ncbi:MAG: hypothetical protein LBB39_00680 [Mycoplasmataceae bacterium]|jgi:predicted AAA+ superfamily ATPase|nr:hypothetical protein [Mycoplasmataceae bacterium]
MKFFRQNRSGDDIDFVIKKDNIIKYVQVCETLDDKNFETESRSLLKIKDAYDKFIICSTISVSRTRRIKIIYLGDFLVKKDW